MRQDLLAFELTVPLQNYPSPRHQLECERRQSMLGLSE